MFCLDFEVQEEMAVCLFVYKEFIVSFNNSVYKKTKNMKKLNKLWFSQRQRNLHFLIMLPLQFAHSANGQPLQKT